MSSRDITVVGYAACVAFGAALQLRSRNPNSRIPSLGAVLSRVMRTRSGRVGVVAGWAWLGLHFFAR
jgi:uncharacterized protein DUF6186